MHKPKGRNYRCRWGTSGIYQPKSHSKEIIFLLSRNPDGTYGFYYGPWSRLIVEGQQLHISDGLQGRLAFGAQNISVNLDEFMQLINNEITSHVIFLPFVSR